MLDPRLRRRVHRRHGRARARTWDRPRPRALDLAGRRALLDIAGGSGIYACAFVDRHPHLTATVFERPPVDGWRARAIAGRGFATGSACRAGDMLRDPLPPRARRPPALERPARLGRAGGRPYPRAPASRRSPPGGLLVIHDAHLNAGKTGPLPVAAYSVMLMHGTEGRCYSVAEMFERTSAAGFRDQAFVETAGDRSLVTARKPA